MSFSVSFTSHHPYVLAFLPGFYRAGLGHEYDRDKPSYAVKAAVLHQRGYFVEPQRKPPEVRVYVRLVACYVPAAWRNTSPLADVGRQAVQGIEKSRHAGHVRPWENQVPRPAAGQHLADPITQVLPPLP